MNHDSDGEQTRPYTGAPPVGGPWTGRPTPHAMPPQPSWTPPSAGSWPQQVAAPAPVPSPPRSKALRWTVIGLVVLAVIVCALAVRMTMRKETPQATNAAPSPQPAPNASTAGGASSNTTPAPGAPVAPAAGPTVNSARLAEFLSSATALTDLLIVEHLVQTTDSDSLYTAAPTDRPECGGAINVGLPTAYDGSGYTAIRLQEYRDVPGDRYGYGVTEAVSTFPSDQQAQDFVSTEAQRWAKCKYKQVTLLDRGTESFVSTILPPETNAGVLDVSTLSKSYSGLGCQRAMSAKRNVVIDVQICGSGGSAQAPALIAEIADRIPTT